MLTFEKSAITFGKGQVSHTSIFKFREVVPEFSDRFLGGSSGCNGALCIRGSHLDYGAWGLEGWSGEEMYKFVARVREVSHRREKFKN